MAAAAGYEKEVEAYKNFREQKLLPERNSVKKLLEDLEAESASYKLIGERAADLQRTNISAPNEPIKIELDLGSGYSADFEVFDKDFVLVAVGFGFYCQMTWLEAEAFCKAKGELLAKKQMRLKGKLDKMEEHLRLTNEIISQLSQ